MLHRTLAMMTVLAAAAATPAQPYLVRDLNDAPSPVGIDAPASGFCPLGGGRGVYFTRFGLHVTDGTPAGSSLIGAGLAHLQGPVPIAPGLALVAARPPGVQSGLPIYVTDGTPGGTRPLLSAAGQPLFGGGLRAAGTGAAYFTGSPGTSSPAAVWRTDGTPAGTRSTRAMFGGPGSDYARAITAAEGLAYVAVGISGRVWRTDGTDAGTVELNTFAQSLASNGQTVWCVTGSGVGSLTATRPPRTDFTAESISPAGVAAGRLVLHVYDHLQDTHALAAVSPDGSAVTLGALDYDAAPADLALAADGSVGVYASVDGDVGVLDAGSHRHFRRGTVPGLANHPPRPAVALGRGWFAWGGSAWGQFASVGAEPAVGFQTATSITGAVGEAGGRLLFNASQSGLGEELWSSDGTAAGTSILHDLGQPVGTANSAPTGHVSVGGRAYFIASTGLAPRLWCTDGTAPGTRPVTSPDRPDGFTSPALLHPTPEHLYFHDAVGMVAVRGATGAAERVGPRNGGESAGTSVYTTAATTPGGITYWIAAPASGAELWRSDGTAAGSRMVAPIVFPRTPPAPARRVGNLVPLGAGRVAFLVLDSGAELWASDGTAAGTLKVAGGVPGLSPTFTSTRAIYRAGGGLTSTDGTPQGTVSAAASVSHMLGIGGTLFTAGAALERRDPATLAPTTLAAVSVAAPLGRAGDRVLAATTTGVYGSDGTAAGTARLTPLTTLSPFVPAGSEAYFVASDRWVWRTDGTPAGTQRVVEYDPAQTGSGLSYPLAVAGPRLILRRTTAAHGMEPWALDMRPAADCDADGVNDLVQIGTGAAADANRDGVPDACGCLADWDPADPLGLPDVFAFLSDWFAGDADFNHVDGTELLDIFAFLAAWFAGC